MSIPAERQTARYERKREVILESAVRLFNARGLSGTTLADVAQSVGLTTTSVTYYYRRKEDLAAACIMRALDSMEGLVSTAELQSSPEARLRTLVTLYFEQQAQAMLGKLLPLINFWDLRALTGPGADAAAEAVSQVFRRLRRWFDHSSAPELPHSSKNARTFLAFVALLFAKEWMTRFEIEDLPRCAECLADVLIKGLAGEGSVWNMAAPISLPRLSVAEVSHDAFLRAATELVNEQGYRGASVDRISAKLSVTKGSFYHHNETKDELIAQCFERSFGVIRAAHRASPRGSGDGWGRLCAIMTALVRYQRSEHGPLLRSTALAAMPEHMRPGLMNDMVRLANRTAGVVVDGIADLSIRPVDPIIAAQFVSGSVNAAAELHHWVRGITEQEAITLFVRPCLLGIFSPP